MIYLISKLASVPRYARGTLNSVSHLSSRLQFINHDGDKCPSKTIIMSEIESFISFANKLKELLNHSSLRLEVFISYLIQIEINSRNESRTCLQYCNILKIGRSRDHLSSPCVSVELY